jgi:hypothetical protein
MIMNHPISKSMSDSICSENCDIRCRVNVQNIGNIRLSVEMSHETSALDISIYTDTSVDIHDGWVSLNGWINNQDKHTAISTLDSVILDSVTLDQPENTDTKIEFEKFMLRSFSSTRYTERYHPRYKMSVNNRNRSDKEVILFSSYEWYGNQHLENGLMTDEIFEFRKSCRFNYRINWTPFSERNMWDNDRENNEKFDDYTIDLWSSPESGILYYIICIYDQVISTIREVGNTLQEGGSFSGSLMFKDGNILVVNSGYISSCILIKDPHYTHPRYRDD